MNDTSQRLNGQFTSIVKSRQRHRANAILSVGALRGQWELDKLSVTEVRERFYNFVNSGQESNVVLRACFTCACMDTDEEMLFIFVPKEDVAFCLLKSKQFALTKQQETLALNVDSSFTKPVSKTCAIDTFSVDDKYRVCAQDKMHVWCLALTN